MNLHNNKKAFRQAIQYTADQLRISPVFIEKDYWVTFALYTISNQRKFRTGKRRYRIRGHMARIL